MKKSNAAVSATTIKQTQKAVQISIDDMVMWFPKSKVEFDESGNVIAVSKKMLDNKMIDAQEEKENNEWNKNGFVKQHKNCIEQETEKALLVKFDAFISGDGRYGDIDISLWFPKSITKIENDFIFIPAWSFLRSAKDKRNSMGVRALDVYSKDESGNMVIG